MITDHRKVRKALFTLLDGRKMLVTVPSIDGFECAAWDLHVSARDVLEACEKDQVTPAARLPALRPGCAPC